MENKTLQERLRDAQIERIRLRGLEEVKEPIEGLPKKKVSEVKPVRGF